MSEGSKDKHRSPAKRIRNMKRLLSFLLAKLKKLTLPTKPDVQYETIGISHGYVLPHPPRESVTMNDFLRITRKAEQEIEQRRKEDREKDLRNIENLMRRQCPNTGFSYPHI